MPIILTVISLFGLVHASAVKLTPYVFSLYPRPDEGEHDEFIQRVEAMVRAGNAANFGYDSTRGLVTVDVEPLTSEFLEMSPAVRMVSESSRSSGCESPMTGEPR